MNFFFQYESHKNFYFSSNFDLVSDLIYYGKYLNRVVFQAERSISFFGIYCVLGCALRNKRARLLESSDDFYFQFQFLQTAFALHTNFNFFFFE